MSEKKEVKSLGRLTLALAKQISQCDPNNTCEALIKRHDQATAEEKLKIEQEYPSLFSAVNIAPDHYHLAIGHQYMGINPLDYYNISDIEKINEESFRKAEADGNNRMLEHSKKMSRLAQKRDEEKEKMEQEKAKIEQDRHIQLIGALEKNSNNLEMGSEISKLKAEIEKLQSTNEQLAQENNQLKRNSQDLGTRERDNVYKIIAILADMAKLPKNQPSVSFNMMQSHASSNRLEIPSTNTVTKYLKGENF